MDQSKGCFSYFCNHTVTVSFGPIHLQYIEYIYELKRSLEGNILKSPTTKGKMKRYRTCYKGKTQIEDDQGESTGILCSYNVSNDAQKRKKNSWRNNSRSSKDEKWQITTSKAGLSQQIKGSRSQLHGNHS